jgi:catechol 2,3-dioxygenase-like lactoylglutathione lyase family enzyme
MTFALPPLAPELEVTDIERSLAVYVGVFGFRLHVRRPEHGFAYLIREGAHLMLEQAGGSGRSFSPAPMERPFGRGMNLQITVTDVAALYDAVRRAGLEVPVPLEERWYRHDAAELGQRQFVAADPDGYLLRFATPLGTRAAP